LLKNVKISLLFYQQQIKALWQDTAKRPRRSSKIMTFEATLLSRRGYQYSVVSILLQVMNIVFGKFVQ